MEKMKTYTLEEVTDMIVGKIGTPERDKFEQDLKDEIQAYRIGEAIKQARKAKNLTQQQLGKKVGVQKAQISRLENGKSITLSNMIKIFKAMDISATLDMGSIGKFALC